MANAKEGWIKAWRKLAINEIWLEKPFSKGQAWLDLLMFATQSTHSSVRKGVTVVYEAGCVYESIMGLADRWGWSRNKVYRFLEYLKNHGMIEFQGRTPNGTLNGTPNGTVDGTQVGTPLRIVNWELYQDRRTVDGTVDGTQNGTQNRTRNGTHPKNIYPKNDKSKEEKKGSLRSDFPKTIDEIIPERDLAGYPPFEEMLPIGEGTKRDIPQRVRELFDGDYDAYWRYMQRCHTQ